MTQDSIRFTNQQIDQINIAGYSFHRHNLKQLINEYFPNTLQLWKPVNPSKGYRYHEILDLPLNDSNCFDNSIIELFYNPSLVNPKAPNNNKFLCIIHGKTLNRLELGDQIKLLLSLSLKFEVTELHIKLQENNPVKSPQDIAKLIGYNSNNKIKVSDYCSPYKTALYMASLPCEHNPQCESLYFPRDTRKAYIALTIYDPLIKHGIKNALHWELRLKKRYIHPIYPLQYLFVNEGQIAQAINEIVLGSIHFKDSDWWNELTKDINPIKPIVIK
jgi:hypothetical protein